LVLGFKLHLVVNDQGELLNIMLPPATSTTASQCLNYSKPYLAKSLQTGLRVASVFEQLLHTYGIALYAKPKRNMKPRLMRLTDKLLARNAAILNRSSIN
jgi:hypothetical protein